tara:strand:- start:823 stop:1203 length:381 start_codon:yes stop_codon:yes gene_type:complete
MKNFKQYFITYIGMGLLALYYVSRFFEIDFDYLLQITIFILSGCLLLKLFYWYNIGKSSERENLLRFSFIVLTYFLPIYMIIQEPTLIIDLTILKISYVIIFTFAFIGILIERYLFAMKEKIKENL